MTSARVRPFRVGDSVREAARPERVGVVVETGRVSHLGYTLRVQWAATETRPVLLSYEHPDDLRHAAPLRAYWWRLTTPDVTAEGFRHDTDAGAVLEWLTERYEGWISYVLERRSVIVMIRGFVTHRTGPRVVLESRGHLLTRPAPSTYDEGVISRAHGRAVELYQHDCEQIEASTVWRCKHRKRGGGVVDGCGWQGALPDDARCPGCGSDLLRRVTR